MSIASEITRLQGVKSDILQAISDKGVEVPSGSKLDDCPDLIASISGGGGGGGVPYLKNIMPTTGVKVVDESGYIGGDFLGVYYPSTNYYNNFAVVIPGADYSASGLGSVTFVDTTTTIGGRVYRTVTIGGVTWLAENLDYKFSGCGIGGGGTPTTPNAWYYNNDEATYGIDGVRKCGLLYNWYAVKLLNDNRSDLIPGWHVPTNDEWTALANAVGGTGVAGTRLKAANVDWATSWGGTDDYGFGVLPAGYYDGSFSLVGSYAYFWTITESGDSAYLRYFGTGATMFQNTYSKYHGFSVRLVKDS
ncbi:FISUMP domain-containing protein [uncultured Fibrobacter sp.]|uniref:FISUMP domain-containing protein n=1 Tax=uncultured Fibrobacter sp. TaxID=261512 RepID=UPI0025D8E4D8|nr:FISUMP domain-containing protein [uncultured Fibrobacter sp.]